MVETVQIWHRLIKTHKRLRLSIIGYTRMIEKLETGQLLQAFEWLDNFEKTKAIRVEKIRKLCSEETWAYYEIIGLKDTQEQKLLKHVDNDYKSTWLNGPLYKKEFKHVESKNRKERTETGPAF